MLMLKVIADIIKFLPFLQRYVQPHQKDITNLLAAAVQACHNMVPPDAVEPLFKQIVNQFVHDRSRQELMTEDLLQDLVLCKKFMRRRFHSQLTYSLLRLESCFIFRFALH